MGTQLAIIKPLPTPVPANPTPPLPKWAVTLHAAVHTNTQVDLETGEIVDALVLRQESMPTPAQRVALENHKTQLAALLELTPMNENECAKRTLGLIAKLLLALPARDAGLEAAEARIEFYLMGLDDVPSWAVASVVRKWSRGQCDHLYVYDGPTEQYDYRWAPSSAELRKLALREAYELNRRIKQIDRVLAAVPFQDRTEVRRRNHAAIVTALAQAAPFGATIDEAAEIGRKLIEQRNTTDQTRQVLSDAI
jgi:hypothetical protein